MPRYCERAIYLELGEEIGKEAKERRYEIILNHEDATCNFSGSSDSSVKKIIKVKKSKGKGAVMNEFHPDCIVAHLKWNMNDKDRKCLIKKFHDFETMLGHLITEQRIICEKLRKNLEVN